MGKFSSFEEINSWQKSRIFNKRIYQITENSNFKKDFDLEYIAKQEFDELLESVTEISKLISGFIKYLSPKL